MEKSRFKLFLPLLQLMIMLQKSSPLIVEKEYAPVQVTGLLNGEADIPCNSVSDKTEDKVNLILWYKDDNKDPIYSYDARKSHNHHHLKDVALDGRAAFHPSLNLNDPNVLRINSVRESDAGMYSCRVDYLMAQSSTRSAILKVVLPVNSVDITDGDGKPAASILPPIPEGGTLNVTCTARGGKPSPKVSWWVEDEHVDSTYLHVTPGVVSNNLVIQNLPRDLVHKTLTCKAEPSEGSFKEASTTIDMHLGPEVVKVSGQGSSGLVKAGDMLDLNCVAQGSRPPPRITWYKGSKTIHTQSPARKSTPGYSAVGHVRLQVNREDNGVRVTCRVINPALPQHVAQDQIVLNVTYPPELELRMGSIMESTDVKELADLYLTCHIDSNPDPDVISFAHQGKIITPDKEKGILISGNNLVLRNIKRSQAGSYTCQARNTEGTAVSVPVNISVQYAPVCAESPDVWADQGSHVRAYCKVHSSPNTSLEIYWIWITPSYSRRIKPQYVKNRGDRSDVTFTIPKENMTLQRVNNKYSLGSLQCWAKNKVGETKDPCTVSIYRPAPPPPPANCSVVGSSESSVTIQCQAGGPMNLSISYNMRIYESKSRTLLVNKTSSQPKFVVFGLMNDHQYIIKVSAHSKYGKSRDETMEAFKFKMAENRMRNKRDEYPWHYYFIFVGVVGGALLFIIIVVALVRMRLRRSQHKCTVRKIPPGENHHKNIMASPLNTPMIEKRSPSLQLHEKPTRIINSPTTQTTAHTNFIHPTSDDISPKENPPLQPIIRQPSIPRLQPIIKENGRIEPVKNIQPGRTVIFAEPPKPHTSILINKDESPRPYEAANYAPRRNSSVKSHTSDTLSPHMYRQPSRNIYNDNPYSEREHRYRSHIDDEGIETLDHQYSSGSSNTLSRESGYCSPRHHLPSTANYGRASLDRDRIPPEPAPSDQRHVFTFPNSQSRTIDYSHLPVRGRTSPIPRPSIMKKSPSVSGDVSHYYDNPRPGEHTRYRSLPRPGKARSHDMDNLMRYQSLDRRFDIPFTGSLPRPERRYSGESGSVGRRRNSTTRLRFADEKLFHVYPEKNKRQNAVDDDTDENFV